MLLSHISKNVQSNDHDGKTSLDAGGGNTKSSIDFHAILKAVRLFLSEAERGPNLIDH